MNEIRELSKTKFSLSESVEASLKAFDVSLSEVHLNYIYFKDKSNKASIQVLYEGGLFEKFENKDEIFSEYIISNTRRRGDLDTENIINTIF